GADERQLANQDFLDVMRESCNWVLEPLRVSGPFDFGDENHFKRGADILARIVLKRYTQGHPVFVYWNRSILGLRSLMYQLSAQIDVRALNEEERLPCPRL